MSDWEKRRRWKVAILRRLFWERDHETRVDLVMALLNLELADKGLRAEKVIVGFGKMTECNKKRYAELANAIPRIVEKKSPPRGRGSSLDS